ncbi:hypothetical protein AADE18_004652, partial [Salmonella enterica]
MKLCLNLEADRINVLALNMGRIAVEVDGIDLAELIDVVCDNGYSLRVVEESDKGRRIHAATVYLPVRDV